MIIHIPRETGATGAEELANHEAKHGRVSREGYTYWMMRGEYSRLSPEGLKAWAARDAAEKAAEATPFDKTVQAYLDKLTPEARERKLHSWGAKVPKR